MSELTVARRYAHALYEEADRQAATDAVDEDVDLLRQSLDETPEFARLVESPAIPQNKKKAVFRALLEDRVAPVTLRFLQLLAEKNREVLLASILDTYRRLRDEQQDIVEVQARVPTSLGDEARARLTDRLEAMTGKTVRLQVDEQPDLIGGLVIRIGDRVYDGSVRQKLDNLHESWSIAAHASNGQA